jgi:hypothetical protein
VIWNRCALAPFVTTTRSLTAKPVALVTGRLDHGDTIPARSVVAAVQPPMMLTESHWAVPPGPKFTAKSESVPPVV